MDRALARVSGAGLLDAAVAEQRPAHLLPCRVVENKRAEVRAETSRIECDLNWIEMTCLPIACRQARPMWYIEGSVLARSDRMSNER